MEDRAIGLALLGIAACIGFIWVFRNSILNAHDEIQTDFDDLKEREKQ